MAIKVRAKRKGFYDGSLRIPNTASAEFEVKSIKDIPSWAERVGVVVSAESDVATMAEEPTVEAQTEESGAADLL